MAFGDNVLRSAYTKPRKVTIFFATGQKKEQIILKDFLKGLKAEKLSFSQNGKI